MNIWMLGRVVQHHRSAPGVLTTIAVGNEGASRALYDLAYEGEGEIAFEDCAAEAIADPRAMAKELTGRIDQQEQDHSFFAHEHSIEFDFVARDDSK